MWVWFYGLNWVYWHPQILLDLARNIGVPLKIYQSTISGDFGHFPRVLVDVELAAHILGFVLLILGGQHIDVKLHYENLLNFCIIYGNVGHSVANCQHLRKNQRLGLL